MKTTQYSNINILNILNNQEKCDKITDITLMENNFGYHIWNYFNDIYNDYNNFLLYYINRFILGK